MARLLEDGTFRLDKARTFLRSYQDTLLAHPDAVVLTPEEKPGHPPVMVNAGNLYVLHWTIWDYFAKDADPAEYLTFLDHSSNFTICIPAAQELPSTADNDCNCALADPLTE